MMKKTDLKKLLAVLLAVLMVISLTACGKEDDVAELPDEQMMEDDLSDESDEEYFNEDADGTEAGEEAPAEETVEEAPAEEDNSSQEADTGEAGGQISFQQVMDSYNSLVEVYNNVNDLYLNEKIPRDENFEKLTDEISAEMDKIAALNESDIPGDEEKLAVLQRIGELDDTLGQLIDALFEIAQEEEANYNQLADIVEDNYQYMNNYFNAAWDYFAQKGGSNEQIQVLVQARDEIGEIGDLSRETTEDLKELNDRIDHVTSLLDALSASI